MIQSKINIFNIFIVATFFVVVGVVLWSVIATRQRDAKLIAEQNSLQIEEPFKITGISDREVMYQASYCLDERRPFRVQRTYVGVKSKTVDIAPVDANLEPGCHTETFIVERLKELEPGDYKISLYFTEPSINYNKIFYSEGFRL